MVAAVLSLIALEGVCVDGHVVTNVERRMFAEGEAVRYVLPGEYQSVSGETTYWTLPKDARVWFQPFGNAYESPYTNSVVSLLPVGTEIAMPVTALLPDGTYVLLTEANVVEWPDCGITYEGDGRFYVKCFTEPADFEPLTTSTPWRVTVRTKDMNAFVNCDIVKRLCPAPSPHVAERCAEFVRKGRCIWQWLPAGAPKYKEQKHWYDLTKQLGFEYYLIDDGWRDWRDGGKDQWACLKHWIDYGNSLGVGTFIWVDSKEMRTAESRCKYLDKVAASGAVGIKIDFIPPGSLAVMRWYEATLKDTFERGLMTDFHGAVKPSGRERTWPHEVAREAVRGHEWHITRYKRILPPEHDCILPFHRLIQGHADYTPVVLEQKELVGYTWARELAQGVIFSAPFLCFGDFPVNYLLCPAADFVKSLPATYDETRILPGSEIGKCVAFARRKGREWFIAVENGGEERALAFPLSFLGAPGKMTAYSDSEDRQDAVVVTKEMVYPDRVLRMKLKACGGYVAQIALARD